MIIVWILFACSVVVLPLLAVLALQWAVRNGEFRDLPKTAISIFDDEEPLGVMSDHFPGERPAPVPVSNSPRLPAQSRS